MWVARLMCTDNAKTLSVEASCNWASSHPPCSPTLMRLHMVSSYAARSCNLALRAGGIVSLQ
jgi:hypothetical protein